MQDPPLRVSTRTRVYSHSRLLALVITRTRDHSHTRSLTLAIHTRTRNSHIQIHQLTLYVLTSLPKSTYEQDACARKFLASAHESLAVVCKLAAERHCNYSREFITLLCNSQVAGTRCVMIVVCPLCATSQFVLLAKLLQRRRKMILDGGALNS